MFRQVLWLVFDVVLGILLTGLVAPLAIPQLPEPLKGAHTVWGLALLCVVLVAFGRRLLGIGAVKRAQ